MFKKQQPKLLTKQMPAAEAKTEGVKEQTAVEIPINNADKKPEEVKQAA